MDKVLDSLLDLDSEQPRSNHLDNVCARVGKWVLRNEERPEVLPKTVLALSRSIKPMCSFSYLDLGSLLTTLKFYDEQGVFEVNSETGDVTYRKKEEKGEGEESSDDEDDERRGLLSLSEEQRLEKEWIVHPHNSPKHISKLVSCVAFRSQRKEESKPLDVVDYLVDKGKISWGIFFMCVNCFVLFCFVLFCFVLFCFVLFYFILFYFILFYFILFYFILFYFILFYFILFYFISFIIY